MLKSEQVRQHIKKERLYTVYIEQVRLDSEQKSMYRKQKRQNSEQAAVMCSKQSAVMCNEQVIG
jgi:hypothetical protein